MKYNPDIHHRRSIRLKGYDYSQAGLYFVTICTQNRECFFGNITNGEMNLNDAAQMVERWYLELENKFPDIKCREHITMPNHFHCIIENVGLKTNGENVSNNSNVGADLRVCPSCGNGGGEHMPNEGEHMPNEGEHIGSPLHRVVQWFKTMSSNEYIRGVKNHDWQRFNGKLWQRNYYENIISDEEFHYQISEYIVNNPLKWDTDKYYIS
jgi:putative transposase